MAELDADSIFYGDSSPRLAIEDIQAEASSDPKGYAEDLIARCQEDLAKHFLPPLSSTRVTMEARDDGSIRYVSDDVSGVIEPYDLQVDDWFWRLLHARRD